MNHPPHAWYALYTRSKHEKRVCLYLDQKRIQSFLPMTTEIRTWSDRKKKLTLPLFPNYVFVYIRPNELWKVSDLPGAVRFIGLGKRPTPVPTPVIESLQTLQYQPMHVDDLNLYQGEKVRIISGEFMGVEGEYIRTGSKQFLAIGIEIMNRVVVIELKAHQIQRLQKLQPEAVPATLN